MALRKPHGKANDARSMRSSHASEWPPPRMRIGCSTSPVCDEAELCARLDILAGDPPLLRVDGLVAGYGTAAILRGINLRLGRGQSLCLIGPNGAGKSTVLNSIFGLTNIRAGRIEFDGRNVTRLGTNAKLRDAGIAYVLQDSSLFPNLTVEQNLCLGGNLMGHLPNTRQAAERVFDQYGCLALHRNSPAGSLSGGLRRMLDIARALVLQPRLLLIDEPSIGVERSCVEQIFGMLRDFRDRERISMVFAETNAKRGLQLADIGCVLVAGEIALVGTGDELLANLSVGRYFVGH
jgi:branched-chain amino acid transport system ATP-binding protein